MVGAIGIAWAPLFVRDSDLSATATAFQRVLLALPLLWLLRWREVRNEEPSNAPRRVPWILVLAGLCFAGDLAVWHLSIHYTSVANATLLPNTAPIVVGLVAWKLFDERPGREFVLGFLLAIVGVSLVVGASFGGSEKALMGDSLGLATAVFYAGYQLCVKVGRGNHTTLSVMATSTTVCCLALLPFALASGDSLWPPSPREWRLMLGLAWISHCGGQGLIAWALAHLPVSFSSVALLLQPVAAAFFAWWLLGEELTITQALGGLVVLVGILIVRRGSQRTR